MSGAYSPPSFNYDQQSVPQTPVAGQIWRERSNDGLIVEWIWNGANWISKELFRLSIGSLSSGQVIVLGGVIGLLKNDSQDVPVNTGNVYSIYLVKLDVGFVISSSLSTSNYWKLLFKSGGTTVQTLNITSGNNGETTGEVRKSSSDINQIYAHNGRYSIQLIKQGSPPDANSPTATIEYRLVR